MAAYRGDSNLAWTPRLKVVIEVVILDIYIVLDATLRDRQFTWLSTDAPLLTYSCGVATAQVV